jgi:hypothetical protein
LQKEQAAHVGKDKEAVTDEEKESTKDKAYQLALQKLGLESSLLSVKQDPSLKYPEIFQGATNQQNADFSLLMYLSNTGIST